MKSTDHPTMLVLSRQNLPVLPKTAELASTHVSKGAYVLSPQDGEVPEGILIATGSEVALAMESQKALKAAGKDVSVVSMPSFDLFEKQDAAYKESVLPNAVRKRVSIEMGSSFGWERYVGLDGTMIAVDKYGASAPGDKVIKEYGFTVDNVVEKYNAL